MTDATIQSLWAQAFARQTNSDSRQISLRTLDTLRLMDSNDAWSFMRAVDVLNVMGYVFVNTDEIRNRIVKPEAFDALVDLRLIDYEEQLASGFAAKGGFVVYFNMPPEFAKEAFRVVRLSARGRELAQTLPKDEKAEYPYDRAYNTSDPLLIPKYVSLVTTNFDRRYEISLCLHDPAEQRPPPGGRKRTHEWDRKTDSWKRFRMPDYKVEPAILDELERARR